jgi:hypothetical protein
MMVKSMNAAREIQTFVYADEVGYNHCFYYFIIIFAVLTLPPATFHHSVVILYVDQRRPYGSAPQGNCHGG